MLAPAQLSTGVGPYPRIWGGKLRTHHRRGFRKAPRSGGFDTAVVDPTVF